MRTEGPVQLACAAYAASKSKQVLRFAQDDKTRNIPRGIGKQIGWMLPFLPYPVQKFVPDAGQRQEPRVAVVEA
jgi:hypothetical protein